MDKRSLLFVFLMTTSFLFMNHFFFDKPQEIQSPDQVAVLQQKVAPISSLPVTPLTYEAHTESFATNAVELGNSFLTFAWDKKAPKSLYNKGEKLDLVAQDKSLLFYSNSDSPKVLASFFGKQDRDLQMISDLDTSTTNTLAESTGKVVSFPLGDQTAHNCIALTDTPEGWSFVGIWSEKSDSFLELKDLPAMAPHLMLTKDSMPVQRSSESYYVLENDYAQFVFSNLGGALAEINLPFQGKENYKSVVKPIQFDYDIRDNSPTNAQFPNYSYTTVENGSRVKKDPTEGGYMPLLRRTLKKKDGAALHSISPEYYALQMYQESGSKEPSGFKVTNFTNSSITFEGIVSGRKISKTFKIIPEAPYSLDMTVSVNGSSEGLWISSGIPEVELVSGANAPLLQYYSANGRKGSVSKLKLPKTENTQNEVHPVWTSNQNGFFALIIDPTVESTEGVHVEKVNGLDVPTRLTLIDAAYDAYPAKDYPGYTVAIPYKATPKPLSFNFYAGPLENKILAQVDSALVNPTTGRSPQFSKAIAFHGWFSFISAPFAKFLFLLMQFFHMITHSWGISIILLTVALRVMMYPLNAWSYKSMAKMQEIGPKQKKIQDKFKDDPKRLQMEMAMLYKNENYNPFSGCLPMIIQIPFFIGMYDLLKSVFELRGAPFIPGWINSLTEPDVLFSWSYPIPFFGTSFHLLPVIMGLMMLLQQKISKNQQKNNPVQLSDQQKQMQSMGTIMAAVFFFLFYNLPSGLNIYIIFSTALGILQQWYSTSRLQEKSRKPKVMKD